MKPVRIWAKNYGPHPDIEWAIPEGVTAILGRNEGEGINSNGAGKTRLLEIIPIALFGPNASWSDYLTTGSASPICEVGCEFEHGAGLFRVRRTYNASGRGKTTLDFERYLHTVMSDDPETADVWEPLTENNQDATQEAIRQLLGVGEATFSHSVFAAQGASHFADAELTPRMRAEILAEATGLGVYDSFRDLAAGDARRIQAELDSVRGRLGDWERELEGRDDADAAVIAARALVETRQTALEAARAKHTELDTAYRQAREAREGIAAATRERDALAETALGIGRQITDAEQAQAAIADTDELIAMARSIAGDVAAADKEVIRLTGLSEARRTAEQERDRHLADETRARAAAVELRFDATNLEEDAAAKTREVQRLKEADGGVCERCEQPLNAGGLAATLRALTQEAAELADKAKTKQVAITDHLEAADAAAARAAAVDIPDASPEQGAAAQARLETARAAERDLAALEERKRGLAERASADGADLRERLTKALLERDAATARLAELAASVLSEERANELARDALGAHNDADAADAQLREASLELGRCEERARRLAEIAVQNAQAAGTANKLAWDLEVRRELEKAYGRSGIPVLLLESLYIPQIEQEADRILAAWGVPYTVQLVTQKEQKTTDKLKDTLEVVIHEPRGVRRYQTYSGGERDRINVALMVALARLLHRRGSALEVFALDELAHLDAAGTDKLGELLRELQQEIPVVLFISHASQLTDAFDQRVMVVRDGESSRVEVAA